MARADHIFVPRLGGLFTHHGIDYGDGTVVHFTASSWATPRSVQRTSIRDFARGAPVAIRDYGKFFQRLSRPEHLPRRLQIRFRREFSRLVGRNEHVAAFEPDAVIARAVSRIGSSDFDMVLNNCEHFATWCKTGISDSEQVYALWQSILDPMSYLRLRRADFLTSLFETGPSPGRRRT